MQRRQTPFLPERAVYYAWSWWGKRPWAVLQSSEHYVPKNKDVMVQWKMLHKTAEMLNKKKRTTDVKKAQQILGK